MDNYRCPIVPLEVTQLKFSSVDVFLEQLIGKGAFSITYRARCDQLPCVAKVLQFDGAPDKVIVDIEIACQLLSAIRHPNIVQCLGTARKGFENNPIILLEEMEENLSQFLERHRTKQSIVPYYVKVNILCDVALGTAYLHNIDCIHGNLTGSNVLIMGDSRAKVTDFWTLKITSIYSAMQNKINQNSKIYMAPETLRQPPIFTQQSDSYSFGVITVQVDTQEIPKLDRHAPPKNITSKMKQDSPFFTLGGACLGLDSSARPELDGLCKDLVSLKSDAAYETDRQMSRDESESLKRQLLAYRREKEECSVKIKSKDDDIARMKTIIAKLEQEVLDISKENDRLAKRNADCEVFEKHLLRLSSANPTLQRYSEQVFPTLGPTDEPDSTTTAAPPVVYSEIHREYEIIPPKDLELEDNVLGVGKTAEVVSGTWNRKKIALKKYDVTISTQLELEKWRQKVRYEVRMLSKLSHPNLVEVYGAVVVKGLGYVGIVLEHMQCSLCEVAFGKKLFSEAKRKRIVRQVCEGLVFLHNNKMVHCNLTTANIYLSHQSIAKIGSYGPKCVRAKFESIVEDMPLDQIDESYAAPEMLHQSHLTFEQLKKCDVYSLTIVAYEVMTGTRKTCQGSPSLESYGGPLPSSKLPHAMIEIMRSCWEKELEKRPSANWFLTHWRGLS